MSSMNIYVGNLSFNTNEEDLTQHFSQHGEVLSAKVITDRDTGRSRGFGFVEMASRSEGENAIAELNNKSVDGRQLKVNESKPRSDNPRGPRY